MQRVEVVPYDSQWVAEYAAASAEAALVLGANLLKIHHFGSTSIPGLDAKPIIDMLAVVGDIEAVDHDTARLRALGYEPWGEYGIAGRRFFCRDNAAGTRTHQLHAYQSDSPQIFRHLVFRDFMRTHNVPAGQYAILKYELAAAHPNDVVAYTSGKNEFINEIEQRAFAWDAAGRPPEPDSSPNRCPHV